MGLLESEEFIFLLLSEPFDYTEWRKTNLFVGMSLHDICVAAKEYGETHPRLARDMSPEDLRPTPVAKLPLQGNMLNAEEFMPKQQT
jgi:hypothetical protein